MTGRAQFSLRWMFVVTAGAAVLCGQAVAFPDWLADVIGWLVSFFLPTVYISGIVYARGAGQAFCVGALAMYATGLVAIFFVLDSFAVYNGGRVDMCVFWLLTFAGGGVTVAIRWLAAPKPPGSRL